MLRFRIGLLIFAVAALLGMAGAAEALERVEFERQGRRITVQGRLEVEAQDGGVAILAPDGVLWSIPPDQQKNRSSDETPFAPLSREELAAKLLGELPDGFAVHQTAHYLICYDTSKSYMLWCASLFERLYHAFTSFWSNRDFKLREPEFPLVAIVFADREAYARFSREALGDAAGSIIGYYSPDTNRITMYDLTGVAAWNPGGRRRGSAAQIAQILAQPEAARTTATIVHEATHQIAYNAGLHARHSDCPLWFSEGMAIFFETPDLRNTKGWRTIGRVNEPRLAQFYQYLVRRPADSLRTLLADDRRFRNTDSALDAYAEAWALSYYLIRQRGKEYVAYLATLRQKKPMIWDTPETRLAEFTEAFGSLESVDRGMLRFYQRLR